MRTWCWRALAAVTLALGAIGVILPGLPTTPFILVAAWAGAKGWPSLEQRLLDHPRYGSMIRDWRDHRAVPRRAKWLASALMAGSVAVLWVSPAPDLIRWLVPVCLVLVGCWLWTRTEAPSQAR